MNTDGWFKPEINKKYEVLGEYKGQSVEISKRGMQGICIGVRSNAFGMWWAELLPTNEPYSKKEASKQVTSTHWIRTAHLKVVD